MSGRPIDRRACSSHHSVKHVDSPRPYEGMADFAIRFRSHHRGHGLVRNSPIIHPQQQGDASRAVVVGDGGELVRGGPSPGLLAMAIGIMGADYFFLYPIEAFGIDDPSDHMRLIFFVGASFASIGLVWRQQQTQRRLARQNEALEFTTSWDRC